MHAFVSVAVEYIIAYVANIWICLIPRYHWLFLALILRLYAKTKAALLGVAVRENSHANDSFVACIIGGKLPLIKQTVEHANYYIVNL